MLQQLRLRSIPARFRLPLSQQEVYNVLIMAIKLEVNSRGKEYVPTQEITNLVSKLSFYLTEDSHYFGILMCGLCGNGKTTVVKAIRRIIECLNLRDEYGDLWSLRLVDAKTISQRAITDEEWFRSLCRSKMIAIDDLGCEPLEIQHFGNIYTPIVDLLTMRYDRQLFTIMSTNLTPMEIRQRYGDRIADRLNEMVRIAIFTNKSFRLPADK